MDFIFTLNVSLPLPRNPCKMQDAHTSCWFIDVWLRVYTVMNYTQDAFKKSCCLMDVCLTVTVMNYTLNIGLPLPIHPYKIQDAHQFGWFMDVWHTAQLWIILLTSFYLYQGIHRRYKMLISRGALWMSDWQWFILSLSIYLYYDIHTRFSQDTIPQFTLKNFKNKISMLCAGSIICGPFIVRYSKSCNTSKYKTRGQILITMAEIYTGRLGNRYYWFVSVQILLSPIYGYSLYSQYKYQLNSSMCHVYSY